MPDIAQALGCMKESRIPVFGACRFCDDLLLSNVRSASRLPQSPKTVLTALFPYYTGKAENRNLSLYSAIPDYHRVAGDMLEAVCQRLRALFPDGGFVPFTDASPIDEVTAAVRSGLGVRGENRQLIAPRYGSLVFIGEIVTDVAFDVKDRPEAGCEGCMACIRACPTGALSKNGFDRTRCRSFFSQKKGNLTDWEREQLKGGGLVWGCDICTLACPHNGAPAVTPIEAFLSDVEPVLTCDNLPRLMENRAFAWRGEAVLRRNMAIFEE